MEYTPELIQSMRDSISIDGVRDARERIAPFLKPTPLISHPLLNEAAGLDLYVKHENHLPTGAFKVRGGFNLISQLTDDEKSRGVVTATRGNHGQSIAMAAKHFGVRAVIVVPHGNNPEKNAAMRAYGCELIEHGRDYDEAREHCQGLVESEGLRYVHSANEPHLILGVATSSLEILEALPDIDTIIIPIGGGSGICGAITVFRALKPDVEIIGVQAVNASCVYESWKQGKPVTTESADTFADGLATRVPMELPLAIIADNVDDIIIVTEDQLRQAVRLTITTTHNLCEGAGAASIAGAIALKDHLTGKKIAAVLSGGNIDAETLRSIMS
jgi:threonine dehydratase